jgi:hypothetical protein
MPSATARGARTSAGRLRGWSPALLVAGGLAAVLVLAFLWGLRCVCLLAGRGADDEWMAAPSATRRTDSQ